MFPEVLHALSELRNWRSPPVHYAPYVGVDYFQGIKEGVRLLLVGESHYQEEDVPVDQERQHTVACFGQYADLRFDLEKDSTFFRRVGELPVMKPRATRTQIADVWRRLAFTNYVQGSVGSNATFRPNKDHWGTGDAALAKIVDRLEPHAVLFLSRSVWDQVKYGCSAPEPPIKADRRDRPLWLLPHGNGNALCTWTYHPSRNFESQESRMRVLSRLLDLARDGLN